MLLGLVIGTILADALGMADFHAVGEAAMLGITTPFAFGYPVFEPVSCLATALGGIFNTFPYTAFAQNIGPSA